MELFAMSEQQLEELAQRVAELIKDKEQPEQKQPIETREYVYGMKGIASLFNVSRQTAQKYKRTWLKPAISQRGRTIKTDKLLALELFDKNI